MDLVQDTPDAIFIFSRGVVPAPDAPTLWRNAAAERLLAEAKRWTDPHPSGGDRVEASTEGEPSPQHPLVRAFVRALEEVARTREVVEETLTWRDQGGRNRRIRLRGRMWGEYLALRAVDESIRWAAERSAHRRGDLLLGVAEAGAALLSGPWERTFDEAARILGKAAGVSRVYLFRRRPAPPSVWVVDQTHEWCAPGIGSELDNPALQGLDLGQVGAQEVAEVLESGRPFSVRTSEVEDPALQALLESQDALAVLALPLFVEGTWWGYLGMDDCLEPREWSEGEVQALQASALLLASAIDREIRQTEFRQVQRLESVGRLAGGMAHDFNNLLTVIRGNAELALMEAGPTALNAPLLTEIASAAQRGAGLIQQLLAFARRQVTRPEPLALNAVVRDVCQLVDSLVGDHIEVDVELAPGLPPVLADPGQMEQMLMNLVLNARDAMPTGGVLRISTAPAAGAGPGHPQGRGGSPEDGSRQESASPPGGDGNGSGASAPWVLLAVSDEGTGIPPDLQAQVFEPFFTTKPVGQGTGLGLSTVYGIVKQSGGEVFLHSDVGKGTTFRIFFPACTATAWKPGVMAPD